MTNAITRVRTGNMAGLYKIKVRGEIFYGRNPIELMAKVRN